TPLQAAFSGLWTGAVMTVGGFSWMAYAMHQFGQLPWVLCILALLVFSLVCEPQFIVFSLAYHYLRRVPRKRAWSPLVAWLAAGVLYTGIDWILPKLWLDTLGHSQFNRGWIRQVADLGGASVLTGLIFLVNHALAQIYLAIRHREQPSLWPALRAHLPALAGSVLLCVLATLYGRARATELHALWEASTEQTQLAAVQANIGDFEKVAAETGVAAAADRIISQYIELSEKALASTPKPEAIIWPETSYPSTFRTPLTSNELRYDQRLETFSRENRVPLLFGGYDTKDRQDYNSFFFLTPEPDPALLASAQGGIPLERPASEADLQIYHKHILLPFGEYIPLAQYFFDAKKLFPQMGFFGQGPGPTVYRVRLTSTPPKTGANKGKKTAPIPDRYLQFSPIICYEALFPEFSREAARKGSRLILNITNDSWFGPFGEPHLHLALSAFRSIETHLPQLRATNTGITTLIRPDGEITQATEVFSKAYVNVTVKSFPPPSTLFLKWGDWFGRFCLLLAILGVIFLVWPSPSASRGRAKAR
ncbi:MAG: apolipoprotein N-acyltransferase, partial [Bacteriovoracia bacterium]